MHGFTQGKTMRVDELLYWVDSELQHLRERLWVHYMEITSELWRRNMLKER